MSTFPMLEVSNVGKSIELAAAALWNPGLGLLGLYAGFDSLRSAFMVLVLLACILFRPFLLCCLAKMHVLLEKKHQVLLIKLDCVSVQ